jgi:hypothetical protein
MSDAPSRAIKALLMTTGIKHEGWATERMLKKDQKSAAVEKGSPYLIVDQREILHFIVIDEKEVV